MGQTWSPGIDGTSGAGERCRRDVSDFEFVLLRSRKWGIQFGEEDGSDLESD